MSTARKVFAIATVVAGIGAMAAAPQGEPPVTPMSGFTGTIGTTADDSTPAMLPVVRAPEGSPNVIYILFDDVGFSDFQPYGSEIPTPAIDSLAQSGLRYTNFHTAAICSNTRAALLTGRNPHSVGMKDLAVADRGFPNSRGRIPPTAATIAQILGSRGYSTAALGKWHLTPDADTIDNSPRTDWPLGKGFDYFYGFHGGQTDQFHPTLIQDNHAITIPNRPGYHFSEDLVDHAIDTLRAGHNADPTRPFFMYLAFSTVHTPIQAPRAYIEKNLGKYEQGWDAVRKARLERQIAMGLVPPGTTLPPRNPGDRAWDALSADEKTVYARYMAVYAAFIEHADAQVGRLVAYLKASGQFENTLIVLASDNGAPPEAGPQGSFTYPYGDVGRLSIADSLARLDELGTERSMPLYQREWAMASVTPFRFYKLSVYAGGVRDPLIVSWPKRIAARGEVRRQFVDVIDLTPTVLDVTGISAPDSHQGVRQMAMHGRSIAPTFANADAPDPRDTQYFELRANRAIWHDGWKAVATHRNGTSWDADTWELFDVRRDPAETSDLSARDPARLKQLQDLWWREARTYGVLPLTERR